MGELFKSEINNYSFFVCPSATKRQKHLKKPKFANVRLLYLFVMWAVPLVKTRNDYHKYISFEYRISFI